MPVSVILGLQWGDEGKGKICDRFAADATHVLRFQGGSNAGHTLYLPGPGGDRKVVLHLVPSGIFRPGTRNLVGPGAVLDLDVLLDEIDAIEALGVPVTAARLGLDAGCTVIHELHREIDRRLCGAIGTTGRGIGPAYEDLVGRRGLRLADLADARTVRARLVEQAAARGIEGEVRERLDDLAARLVGQGQRLAPLLADVIGEVDRALRQGRRVLAEGAQGTMLDVFLGSYPFVTSSSTSVGGLLAYTGIPPQEVDRVLGIAKAYLTRVGNGPFPTELHDATGERLRQAGHEFGSTTGRPRRCGWLDLPLLAYACRLNGVTDLVLTKADVLAALDEGFGVATAYADTSVIPRALERARPELRRFGAFPAVRGDLAALLEHPVVADLLTTVEGATGVPLRWISLGPGRDDVVARA